MLSPQEQLLYETIKKIAPKIRRRYGLKNVELDDLIQVGCMACLADKTPQDDWPLVAKKAMLKWYYQERAWQNRTKRREITIGQDGDKKNFVEDVIAAPLARTAAEQIEHDKTVQEWEDVAKIPIPSDLKTELQNIQNNLNVKTTHWEWERRKKILRSVREITQGTAEELETALYTAKMHGIAHPRKAFKAFILRRAKLPCNDEWFDKTKVALNCPVVRKALLNMFLPEELEHYLPIAAPRPRSNKEYHAGRYAEISAFLKHYGFKMTPITQRFVGKVTCPLMVLAIKKHAIQHQHPELVKRPSVRIEHFMPLVKRGKRYKEALDHQKMP